MRTRPHSRCRQSVIALVAALHLAFVPAIAGAVGVAPGDATPVQREQAQSKFMKGRDLFTAKKWDEALAEFRGSLDIVASPNTRLFVARCLREQGKFVEAYVEFGRTEVEAKELAQQDARYTKTGESAVEERKLIEPKLGFVTVTVQNPAENTVLKIGGEEYKRAQWAEPAPVMPGTSEVIADTPGHEPVKKSVTLNAGEKTAITIDAGAAAVVPPPGGGVPEKPKDTGGGDYRTYAYIAGGVGAAGLIAFGVFGGLAASRYSTIKDECGSRPCPESKRDLVEGGQTYQTVANISLVVGIIGVGAGVTLFVLSKPKSPSEGTTSAVVGPSYLGLQGTF